MEIKTFSPGDKVELKTKEKIWEGIILESHDPEIILLKLNSGYNIGIRENQILNAKKIGKVESPKRKITEQKQNPKLKNIAMIITGGTISSRLDPKTGGVISTDAEEILNIAPEIKDIANIVKIESPFMKFSEDMDPGDWIEIAKTCEKFLNDKNIEGIIITHGTDTLHYTASALAFFIQDLNKPIALTYSQRSIDRGSTDAALNLICAARYATSDIAEVALVGHADLNDEKCFAMPATKVRKMHTSRRDAFKVINEEPIAEITKDKITFLKEFNARSDKKAKLDAKFLNQIAVIKIHPGINPDILDFYVERKYKGIILEMTGLGHTPTTNSKFNWIARIKKLIDKGIIVCGTAQTIYGGLNPNVYSTGRELQKTGMIFLKDMLSETAFTKLGWILGHKSWASDKEKIREKMLENISGEFNEKIGFENF